MTVIFPAFRNSPLTQSGPGIQPPLKGNARVIVIGRLPPTVHEQHDDAPHGLPMLPPFLMHPVNPMLPPRVFRMRLGVPVVTDAPQVP